MPTDMAHEMGHGGNDLPAMVRDMRNRFLICLVFTVPLFVYSPMGMFTPPAPPFGLDLNVWLFGFASLAIIYPSWPFFVSAWRAIRKGTLGMAALVVLSVGTGYLFSVGATLIERAEQRRNDPSDADAEVVRTQRAQQTGMIGWHRLNATMPAEIVLQRALTYLREPVRDAINTAGSEA